MRIPRSVLYSLLAACFGIAIAAYFSLRGQAVETVQVTQGPLVQTVVTSGRVADITRTEIASQGTSRIDNILVREGDRVLAGQVLVQLRDDEARANANQATAAVAEARMRIRQIQTVQGPVNAQQAEQAMAANRQSQQELQRTQALVQQGFVSQSRLDDAVRAAQTSQAALLAAQAQAAGSQPAGAETALAQTRLEQALSAQRAAMVRVDTLSLRAPAAALVISRANDPGETAQPGKPILTLVGGSDLRIHASVDEKNLKFIKIGQRAKATADAYADRHFDARLIYIAPGVDPQRGTVDLRLQVDPPVDFLRTDMTVSVEIITAQVPIALLLPTEALRKDSAGALYVWVKRESKAQQVAVEAGLQGAGTTEITKGLTKGDQVILPGVQLQAGDRVREQAASPPRGNMPVVPGLTQ